MLPISLFYLFCYSGFFYFREKGKWFYTLLYKPLFSYLLVDNFLFLCKIE